MTEKALCPIGNVGHVTINSVIAFLLWWHEKSFIDWAFFPKWDKEWL